MNTKCAKFASFPYLELELSLNRYLQFKDKHKRALKINTTTHTYVRTIVFFSTFVKTILENILFVKKENSILSSTPFWKDKKTPAAFL